MSVAEGTDGTSWHHQEEPPQLACCQSLELCDVQYAQQLHIKDGSEQSTSHPTTDYWIAEFG